jgi:hypothetical protein
VTAGPGVTVLTLVETAGRRCSKAFDVVLTEG